MRLNPNVRWIPLRPPFLENLFALKTFVNFAHDLELLVAEQSEVALETIQQYQETALGPHRAELGTAYQAVSLALSILGDLISQGWGVRVVDQNVSICKPLPGIDRLAEKERVRRSLLLARNEQLHEAPVRAFVKSMEARQFGPHGWNSIFSLMRDGEEFAKRLESARQQSTPVQQLEMLQSAIQPYLQFVTEDARCDQTGLRLADIWRYFRYTWLTPSRSVPGRSMAILIRDAAIEPHPVIGIAALSSSIVQQSQRDQIISWDKDSVLRQLLSQPTDAMASWLLCSLSELIDGIYAADIVTAEEIETPTKEVAARLTALAIEEKQKHQIHVRNLSYKKQQTMDDWSSLVHSHLYRSKRAKTLASLLTIRRIFQEAAFIDHSGERLRQAAKIADFRAAVGRLARQIKAVHVGINMMDISIAGAVAPYNAILGGKLVSLLLMSPEVRNAYARRYSRTPSIIASAMKGQPVFRTPELVLLCTTGLFTGGSSQYNRVRLPAERVSSGHGEIRYQQLTTETEFATFHISQATMKQMAIYGAQEFNGSNINSIFGEGVNPKMRKITEGLSRMGFPPEEVLKAGSPRAVYMIALAHNYQDVLLGRNPTPDYILPSEDPKATTQHIANFWRTRWLIKRIQQEGILEATAKHRIVYPMSHGAMVNLPKDTDQLPLEIDYAETNESIFESEV